MSVREITEDMLDWFAKDIGAIAFEMQRALERHSALYEDVWTGGDTSERAPERTTKAMSLLRDALALVTEADHEAALFRAEGDAVEIEVSEFPLSVYDDGDVQVRTLLHRHKFLVEWTADDGTYLSDECRRQCDAAVDELVQAGLVFMQIPQLGFRCVRSSPLGGATHRAESDSVGWEILSREAAMIRAMSHAWFALGFDSVIESEDFHSPGVILAEDILSAVLRDSGCLAGTDDEVEAESFRLAEGFVAEYLSSCAFQAS